MYVLKRNGDKETVQFDKITSRIDKLTYGLDKEIVDPILITQKICSRIYSGITTTELDNLASQVCMHQIVDHPDFGILGSRIMISNHQKNTPESFYEVVKILSENRDILGELSPLVNDELVSIAEKYKNELQNMLDMSRDYLIDFFGFKTMERSYLLRINNNEYGKVKKIIERPQHLFLRVAIGIHGDDLESVKKTYDSISLKMYTHATPTLFNACSNTNQLASCFLLGVEDSIEGIFDAYRDCGMISKFAGGIGVHISEIRSKGSYIRKTGGNSDGLMPLLKTFNSVARQFNQSGKRLGSFAMYLEPWHSDILTFLEAKKNSGSDEERARDLFYALWVCDLFMRKIEKDEDWYLMDPNRCPNLANLYGDEFEKLYLGYVSENKFVKKMKARELWEAIISSQIEHGMPYICYKDSVNRKSNQKNIGTIRSSNLCVSGDTYILTSDGYFNIKYLENQDVEVWNGFEWSKTIVRKTGENQKLLKVKFSNGMHIKSTEYHKFHVKIENVATIVEAKDLLPNMKIVKYDIPIVYNNNDDIKYPYIKGYFSGYRKYDGYNEPLLLSNDVNSRFYVPINNSMRSKIKWLEGYFDSEGYVVNKKLEKNNSVSMHIFSLTLTFLQNVLLMLQTLGVKSKIYEEQSDESPEKLIYRLKITNDELIKLTEFGFSPLKLKNINLEYILENNSNNNIKIVSIEECDEYEDTYCFNEPIEHKGIFNGVIAGNCAEIVEYSDAKEIATCNLASICLPSILERPGEDYYIISEWYKLLNHEQKKIASYFFETEELKLYSKEDCDYCKLLKSLLKKCNLKYTEINGSEAEKLRIMSNPSMSTVKPFETVPQLFSVKTPDDIQHLGGYDDCWVILSPKINYNKLSELAYDLTVNLNKIIDKNYYPNEKTRLSNFKHRPLGIGVQGLADVFMMLRIPFTSDEAKRINKDIFETIYWGAMKASLELAKIDGVYSTFEESPLSKGEFQFNLWGVNDSELSGRWNWGELRKEIVKHGVRNSLLIALMPTASTASIFGNVESFETITSNLYTRNVLSGVFTIINKHLVSDLIELGLWNQDTKDRLLYDKGSVQNVKGLPKMFKDIYKISFEIDQKLLIKMSAERGIFVCQSQSLNLFFDKPSFKDLTSSHFYGWKLGLKTGSYYIRTRAGASSQNFGLDINKEKKLKMELENKDEEEGCLNCGA